MNQEFSQPNDAEREWIANSIASARSLVEASRAAGADCAMTPEVLDDAYTHWLGSGEEVEKQANDVVHAIGFAFGQFLVDHDGFEWTIVTDEFGTELGVRAFPGRGDLLVCPVSLVAKRWRTRETGFLVPIYDVVMERRNAVRDMWDSKSKTPGEESG